MSLGRDGFEVLGVSLIDPPPIDQVHFPLAGGFDVLFGPNGAGKSTVLNGLAHALRGVRPDSYDRSRNPVALVHVRITDLAHNLPEGLSTFEAEILSLFAEPEDIEAGRTLQQQWQWLLDERTAITRKQYNKVQDEVYVTLDASGTRENPLWNVYYAEVAQDEDWSYLIERHESTDGPANQQKGDGDAATWLPPNKAFRCEYVARQISVKATYELWVTQAEHDAMALILADCPGQLAPTSHAAPDGGAEPAPEPALPLVTPGAY